ncbi:UNVERIFIED_CONTAM: hypothetical protein Sangu_3118900 [Sesamum angustifolium]|uniref:Uncharacterized protein n=1 Tax=Sesamum angustifolium TaxID=2727405 RepID=A0AAW2K2C9_9LAMI
MDWAQMMVFDAAGSSNFAYSHEGVLDDVHAADHHLWDGCTQSQLGVVIDLVDIKTDGHISKRIYDQISQWANRILPFLLHSAGDYYSSKKLVMDLGLPVEKIDACKNGCMLYWKDDINLEYYTFCGTLGASFPEDETYAGRSPCMLPLATCRLVPVCRVEPRNVRVGLRIESFAPHAYDHAKDRAFIMRAVLMWTVNNLPAYDIASGWGTAGFMGRSVWMIQGHSIGSKSEEVVSLPVVATDNQSHDLRDTNGLQVVVDLSIAQQQAAGTSWRQVQENDDKNYDEDEDNGGDNETDDDEYEAT